MPTAHPTRRAALALSLAATFGLALPASAQSRLSGTYGVQGRNPDGSAYSGTVRVTEQSGVVSMAWQVGSQTYTGTGTFDGQIVRVNWGDSHPVVYVLMSDGSWHGTWSNGLALEKLSR
jgi:hypothetical protein